MGNQFYSLHMQIKEGVAAAFAYDDKYMYFDDYLEMVVNISNEDNQ